MANDKYDLSVFVDESGSITKTNVNRNKYFIIALLFTRNSIKVKRHFRKGIASLFKNESFQRIFNSNGEIKGKDISETDKATIYDRIIRNCSGEFELGVITLSNTYTTEEFIKNHARAFNYLIQMYLNVHFRNFSCYSSNISAMRFIIDNQNIATDAKYTLDGYLNQHLTLENPLCEYFQVNYVDSKNHSLIQLIDFISNTFYRNIVKHDRSSIDNVTKLMNCICKQKLFDFSENKDTKIFLGE